MSQAAGDCTTVRDAITGRSVRPKNNVIITLAVFDLEDLEPSTSIEARVSRHHTITDCVVLAFHERTIRKLLLTALSEP